MTPDTMPGEDPAYPTTTGIPPIVAVTASNGRFSKVPSLRSYSPIDSVRRGLSLTGFM